MKPSALTGIVFCCLVLTAVNPRCASAQNEITPTNRIELFNGTNFDGLTFCMKDNADPLQTWSVTNGVIHCTGVPSGYLRTTQAYSNYNVNVEWRFVKIAPKRDNSGVLVHMQLPDKVWPMCVQNQGKSGRQGDLFVMSGAECKEHLALGKDANTPVAFTGPSAENPIGEWNTNITACGFISRSTQGHEGAYVSAIINGKFMNQIHQCTISNGFVGIQSEGADIEIRKMSLFIFPGTVDETEAIPHEYPAILEPKFRGP